MTRWRALSAVYVAAIVIGISALLWVQAGYAEPGYDKLALPLTYAIATLAVVVGLVAGTTAMREFDLSIILHKQQYPGKAGVLL